jgi:hypothetical protein
LPKCLYRGAERGGFDSYTESEGQQNLEITTNQEDSGIFKRGRGRGKN